MKLHQTHWLQGAWDKCVLWPTEWNLFLQAVPSADFFKASYDALLSANKKNTNLHWLKQDRFHFFVLAPNTWLRCNTKSLHFFSYVKIYTCFSIILNFSTLLLIVGFNFRLGISFYHTFLMLRKLCIYLNYWLETFSTNCIANIFTTTHSSCHLLVSQFVSPS